MHWIWVAMQARVGWALGELAVASLFAVGLVLTQVPRWRRQAKCKHKRFHETSACDAICTDCGKNLGFIGTWREKISPIECSEIGEAPVERAVND